MSEAVAATYQKRIAQVRAALAEGFCPEGHQLTYGGGKWGSCDTCATSWTVTVPGYYWRPYGQTSGHTSVSEKGECFIYEF